MKGRRCGVLDAGVLLRLAEQKGMSVGDIHHMLYPESGLLGVSGISNDMRVLEAIDDPRAREAIDLFCYRAGREIGALAATLGGLDALVFTAGIGANWDAIRQKIAEGVTWLGARTDPDANARAASSFGSPDSLVGLHRLKTDEEFVIARAVRRILARTSGTP